MFKRLFLLLLCLPLLWTGVDQGITFLFQRSPGVDPQVLAGLRKDLEGLKGKDWELRPRMFQTQVALISDRPDPAGLNPIEKDLLAPWWRHEDWLADARNGLEILDGKPDPLPPKLEKFGVWQQDWRHAEKVNKKGEDLLRQIRAGLEVPETLPFKDLETRFSDLPREAALASSRYFTDYRKNVADLAEASRKVLGWAREAAEKDIPFKELDSLAGQIGPSFPGFQTAAEHLALVWARRHLLNPDKVQGDDKVLVLDDINRWITRPLKLIDVPTKGVNLLKYWKVQFDSEFKWRDKGLGDITPSQRCPTPRSILAFAFCNVCPGPKEINSAHLHRFPEDLKKEYEAQYQKLVRKFETYARKPLESKVPEMKEANPEIWDKVQEVQRLVKENPRLFPGP